MSRTCHSAGTHLRRSVARRALVTWRALGTLTAGLIFLTPACRDRHGGLPRGGEERAIAAETGGDEGAGILGAAPLCEPSAAIRAPWDAQRILVADNEVDDVLFELEAREGALDVRGELAIPAKRGPRDIEALAALPDGRIVVVGSHSRNKACEPRPNRRRVRVLQRDGEGLVEVATLDTTVSWDALDGVERCVTTWFEASVEGAEAVCAALVEAESGAGCGALAIEGAMVDAGELWLGLRAPLVERHALALRMPASGLVDGGVLRFDAVVQLDLDGEAVRELALHEPTETVWILSGASHDSLTAHSLWRTTVAAWRGALGKRLRPEHVMTLPNAAEALVLDAEGTPAFVLIDGAEGTPDCDQPARQQPVVLPSAP